MSPNSWRLWFSRAGMGLWNFFFFKFFRLFQHAAKLVKHCSPQYLTWFLSNLLLVISWYHRLFVETVFFLTSLAAYLPVSPYPISASSYHPYFFSSLWKNPLRNDPLKAGVLQALLTYSVPPWLSQPFPSFVIIFKLIILRVSSHLFPEPRVYIQQPLMSHRYFRLNIFKMKLLSVLFPHCLKYGTAIHLDVQAPNLGNILIPPLPQNYKCIFDLVILFWEFIL